MVGGPGGFAPQKLTNSSRKSCFFIKFKIMIIHKILLMIPNWGRAPGALALDPPLDRHFARLFMHFRNPVKVG
jgi:hypothetical protein